MQFDVQVHVSRYFFFFRVADFCLHSYTRLNRYDNSSILSYGAFDMSTVNNNNSRHYSAVAIAYKINASMA